MRYYYLGASERNYSRGCQERACSGKTPQNPVCSGTGSGLQSFIEGDSCPIWNAEKKWSYIQKAVVGGHGREILGLKPLSGGFLENHLHLEGLKNSSFAVTSQIVVTSLIIVCQSFHSCICSHVWGGDICGMGFILKWLPLPDETLNNRGFEVKMHSLFLLQFLKQHFQGFYFS